MRREFTLDCNGQSLRGDWLRLRRARGLAILLHGGGASSASGFRALRQFMARGSVETIAFDFLGHGESDGKLLESSLASRVAQTICVTRTLLPETRNVALVGFSMGAYVAVQALRYLAIQRVGLAIPAAYAAAALQVPFGPRFSSILRKPKSWRHSDAFEIISSYKGDLLVLSAQNDTVIPHEISALYYGSAVNARSRTHHIVQGAGHDLAAHYASFPNVRRKAYQAILSLCLT